MTFVGHVVSEKIVEIDPKKTEVVKNWPEPLTPKDMRRFMGLFYYYQGFVEGFSSTAASITSLMKKKVKFELGGDL